MIAPKTIPTARILLCATSLAFVPLSSFASTGYDGVTNKASRINSYNNSWSGGMVLLVAHYNAVASATYTVTGAVTTAPGVGTTCKTKAAWGSSDLGTNGGRYDEVVTATTEELRASGTYLSLSIGDCSELPYGTFTIKYTVTVAQKAP